MKVWAEGKPGVDRVRQKLSAYGLELCSSNPEVVVVWGGDGSILWSARKHPRSCILGLRVKSVGQLSEIDGECLEYAVERLAGKDYYVETVPQIELSCGETRLYGLNEVYFCREYEHATRFNVFIDGECPYEGVLFGDGCLAATPRGSSAYSWTAGKRIVLQTDEDAMVFTPLSSGYLTKRINVNDTPVAKPAEQIRVLADKEVVVQILRGGLNKFATDGLDELKKYMRLEKGDELTFRMAEETKKFIRFHPKQN
jgi:NAD kinase